MVRLSPAAKTTTAPNGLPTPAAFAAPAASVTLGTPRHRIAAHLLVIALCAGALSACALAARAPAMVARTDSVAPARAPAPPRRIAVAAVEGGEETGTLDRSKVASADLEAALAASLARAGYGGDSSATADFRLSARLTQLSPSSTPLSTTVTSVVRYSLRSADTDAVVFEEEIRAVTRVPWTRSIYGPGRLRLANEESIRANIERLLARLPEVLAKHGP